MPPVTLASVWHPSLPYVLKAALMVAIVIGICWFWRAFWDERP